MNTFTADETRCDHCGQPTPRLFPPQDTELCDACYQACTTSEEQKGLCVYCNEGCEPDRDYHIICAINAAADNQEDR